METIQEKLAAALEKLKTAKSMADSADIKCQIERVIVQLEIALTYEAVSVQN